MRETADFDTQDFADRNRSDPKAFVRFFLLPKKNEQLSAEAGRPIFEDTEYVEIIVPGNDTNRPVLKVTEMEKRRFSSQYQKWKTSGQADFTVGTHLTEVPWITRSQVEELAFSRIRTLEQLAAVSDDVCGRMMGLYELKRKAIAHLEASVASAPLEQLQAQLDAQAAENVALRQAVEEQAALIEELRAAKKGK
jgi:hypothetical protein